jgi:hypothetical protein
MICNSPAFDLGTSCGTRNLIAATLRRSMFRLQWPTYFDAAWLGFENGTYWFPFDTVSEGVSAVPSAGLLLINGGTTSARAMCPSLSPSG